MKLAIYVPVIDRSPAGLGRYIDEICRRLVPRASRVVVASQRGEPPWPGGERVTVEVPPLNRATSGLVGRLERLMWLRSRGARWFRSADADVIFSPAQEGPMWPSGPPACLVVHDLIPLREPRNRRADAAQLRLLLPKMVRRSAAVIAVSQRTRRDLIDLLSVDAEKVHVIHEGVDHSRFFPRSPAAVDEVRAKFRISGDYLLHAGTLAAHKNVETLLRVLAEARSRGHELTLVLAGRADPSDVSRLVGLASRVGVDEHLVVLGYLDEEDLARLMTGAAAFAFPSLYEGFGLAPLEAMACSAPVISSDAGSLPEVIGSAGVLLPPTDVGAWTDAVVRLATDHDEATLARERAVQRADAFGWSQAADLTWELLSEISR